MKEERARLTKGFNFRVTDEMYEEVEREARKRKVPIRTLLRIIIANYLMEVESGNQDPVRSQGG